MGDVGHGQRAGLCPPSDTVVIHAEHVVHSAWILLRCKEIKEHYRVIYPVVKLWGNGVQLPFLAGERRSPSLHDDSYRQHKQQKKYKLLCPRGTQTCALAVANIAHAVREMLDVAKRPILQG